MKCKGHNFKIDERCITMLEAWQQTMLAIKDVPKQSDIITFLKAERRYNRLNYRMLKKFVYTRYKREVLTVSEIEDWYEFYFRPKQDFDTGYSLGPIVKDKFTSIPNKLLNKYQFIKR